MRKEKEKAIYHYCMPMAKVRYGVLVPDPAYSDPDLLPAYQWLEKEVGFFPLFLAVGSSIESIRMTGYPNQKDNVLFSFNNVEGIFMDYGYWHIVLNAGYRNYQISKREKSWIFKYSWSQSRWLKKAEKEPHSVQLVARELDLRRAKRIWVFSQFFREELEKLGFQNVRVRKMRGAN